MVPGSATGRVFATPDEVASYLDELSLKLFRYISAFRFFISEVANLPKQGDALALEELERFAEDKLVTTVRAASPFEYGDGNGGMVDPNSAEFRTAITLIQSDIAHLLAARWGKGPGDAQPHLTRLIKSEPLDLIQEYGSLSHAWDCLVSCKELIAVPAQHEFALGSWHVACVSETERLIREIVVLTLARFGRDALSDVLLRACDELGVDLAVQEVITYDSASEAVTGALRDVMIEDFDETIVAAEVFADGLGFALLGDTKASRGLLSMLSWIDPPMAQDTPAGESEAVSALRELLRWRNSIIHVPVTGDEYDTPRRNSPLFDRRNAGELELVAQFLAGCGLRFGLDTALAVITQAKGGGAESDHPEIAIREWKLAAELRPLHLEMLRAKEWALSWMVAETIEMIGDPSRQDMPQLNALFAQVMLDGDFVEGARDELRAFEASRQLPRYELIRRSALGIVDGVDETLEELLNRALDTRDMTIHELETWPALEPLRQSPRYHEWLRRRTN